MFQIVTLVVFILLIAGGWNIYGDTDTVRYLRNTNLSNLIVWSYWWPLIVIAAVVLGRLWCTICPIELVSFLTTKVGLKWPAPRWLKSGWVITLFYALILIVGMQTLHIHRQPHRMAGYMILLFAAALVISVLFQRRAFCSYVCPIGHLLGMYALLAPLRWGVRDKTVCDRCQTKDCVSPSNQQKLSGRCCTSGLFPPTIQDNRCCLVCMQCAKSCPHGNPGLLVHRPMRDLYGAMRLSMVQTVFVLIVAGFVVYQVLSEWKPSLAVIEWLPGHFNRMLAISGDAAAMSTATLMFVGYPAVFIVVFCAVARFVSSMSFGRLSGDLAVILLPTVAAAHIIKSLVKMNTRLAYLPSAFRDPAGLDTAAHIQRGEMTLSTIALTLDPVVTGAAILLLLTAGLFSIHLLKTSDLFKGQAPAYRGILGAACIGYWAVFAVTVALWRF